MPDFDTSELSALAAELMAAPAKVIPALAPVAYRAGMNMKRIMKADASGHRHLATLPGKVEYEVTQNASSIEVEVGFRDEGQGELANIAAFGSSNNAPVMDITEPLTAEVPSFVKWVAKIGAEAL